jgi:hypothetical protein
MRATGTQAPGEMSTDKEYARHEVAERGGVDLDTVDRLVALGILSPDDDDRFTRGDVRRAAIVQTLVHLMASQQVVEFISRTLSRWRHGFESRWDYTQRRRPEVL